MIPPVKSYGQRCPVSRALDVVGDRWALLVLRELQLGPRRYTDLLDGLPGVGTNVLSARLRDLESAGVVSKRTLPPPTRVTVYETTEAGRAVAPVIEALRDWGAEYGRPATRQDAIRASWLLAPLSRRKARLAHAGVCELRVGDEVFQIRSGRHGMSIFGGAAERPDAVVTLDLRELHALTSGGARVNPSIEGDSEIGAQVLQVLADLASSDEFSAPSGSK
jgi:DNA-binding HxlR family transcriptional regulator